MFHRIIIYRLNSFQCSPFRDSIYRVFSSKKDERLSLEDVLDLCSAFSEYCPDNVRATWAFYVFGNVIHFNFFFFWRINRRNWKINAKIWYTECICSKVHLSVSLWIISFFFFIYYWNYILQLRETSCVRVSKEQ